MDEKISEKLEEEIIRIEEKLERLEPGTEEYRKVADLLKMLHQLWFDKTKAEWDYDEMHEKRLYDNGRTDEDLRLREEEAALKREQHKNDKLFQIIRAALDVVKIVGGAILGILLCMAGFKFEENGAVTSKFFGKVIDAMFRKLT